MLFGAAIASVAAQQCGTQNSNRVCAAGQCCSQYGWCDTTAAHCNPANCQRAFSGAGSGSTGIGNTVPHIDICGAGSGGISCPGAGIGGFFYRCCSGNGHCGPKNTEQSQYDYCGTSHCQPGYGACDPTRSLPPNPAAPATVAGPQENCGPIVNKRCPAGQCCSGSNYCGTGPDFCGAANWCQVNWGECHR
ncbi:hypothetical protein P167DRAFT_554148 [Morchella conica CCBAS932]|uniref:Chitin-binding type-1 domain-containing protein n=1 Tax=Morchella conica CCBAS932 TaxID=1392247 RepID=A0A3N4KKB5_9PEZI|nr:hypothetical protein P167DRAFT_554148 [Morchella conica CCBAS932]